MAVRHYATLLDAPSLKYPVYNVAQGETATIGDLLGWAAEAIPGLESEVIGRSVASADILADPAMTGGMWGAYDIGRIDRRYRMASAPDP